MSPSRPGFETRAIHAGQEPDPVTGAVVPPIHLATTFAQAAVGEHRGFEYGAHRQPDARRARAVPRLARRRDARLRVRERHGRGGRRAAPCSRPATTWCMPDDAYGGTFRLVVEGARADGRRVERGRPHRRRRARACAGATRTRMVWVETPTNPMLTVVDIAAVARRSRTRTARASSSTTRSRRRTCSSRSRSAPTSSCTRATKYLGGHSDVVGGFVAHERRRARRRRSASSRTRSARCRRRSTATSCCAASRRSRSAWIATARTRGRSSRCSAEHPAVERVLYPGLPTHPGHDGGARVRCATSAAWSVVPRRRAARTPRSTWWPRPGCSRWRSRSARSSHSSSTRRA